MGLGHCETARHLQHRHAPLHPHQAARSQVRFQSVVPLLD
jgi:hypothetical protein